MLISFIIPSYNREATIGRAIQSIICQKDYSFEIIVCDGGSTDNTKGVVEKYPSVRFITCPMRSPAAQSEYAIKRSIGDYIAFVDSDDYIDPSYCENVWPVLQKEKPDIFIFKLYSVSGGKINKKYRQKRKLRPGFYSSRDYLKILDDIYGNIGSVSRCTKIVKREVAINLCQYYNSSVKHLIWEDTFYTYPLFLIARSVYISNLYLYYYCVNNLSITHTIKYDFDILGSLEEIFEYHAKIFSAFNRSDQAKQTLTFLSLSILALLKSAGESMDEKAFLSFADAVLKSKIGTKAIKEKVRTTNYSPLDKVYAFLLHKRMFHTFRFLCRAQRKLA